MLFPKQHRIRDRVHLDCSVCKFTKPSSDFSPNPSKPYRKTATCKICRNTKLRIKRNSRIVPTFTRDKTKTPLELFEERYMPEPNSGCWLWLINGRNGYGHATHKGKTWIAHRLSWKLYKGEIPRDKMVCHKCDVRCCVNPDHLFLGTAFDNMQDMHRKGRNKNIRGSGHTLAKINEDIALKIYNSSGFHKDIATEYGVCRELVGQIKRKQIWKHIHA